MMKFYEITATARSSIRERWRVEAASPEEAVRLFGEGEAEFVSDEIFGDVDGRQLEAVNEIDRPRRGPARESAPIISLEAVRFVKKVAEFANTPDGVNVEALVAEARRIAERLR